MAINPSIPLHVQQPKIDSPLDAMQRQLSISDMIGQMNERAQMSEQRKLGMAATKAQMSDQDRLRADQKALDGVMDKHWKFDAATGKSTIDDNGVLAELPGHLHPTYQDRKSNFLTQRNKQVLEELESAHKITEALGVPAKNFLALPEEKRATEYPAVLRALAQADPSLATKLPPAYTPDAAVKLQELVTQRDQIRTIADKVKESEDASKLTELEDDKLDPEARWKKYNPEAGDMPVWYKNAIIAKKSGVNAPPASTYVDKKITTLNGNNLPEDAVDRDGTAIPTSQRNPETLLEQRQDSNGKIYYQVTKSAAQTTKEKEHARIEKAYAMAVGKKYEDLTDAERVEADAWYTRKTPQKQTEHDKRLALYERDPQTYAGLYGHGVNDDRPLTAAQKATILGRINTEISRRSELSAGQQADLRKARLDELKEAGIDLGATPAAKPPAPKADAGYGPTEKRILNKDMGPYKKGQSIEVRKNLKTGEWESVR